MDIKQNYRLRELDFLRGIAIVLVLMRHQYLSGFTTTMGWVGVDLFFVLSGFLVSGLLFREYLREGTVHVTRFLIRRGLKIYPAFYVFLLLSVWFGVTVRQAQIPPRLLVGEILFLQNYVGRLWPHTWSLAVE